MKINDFYLPISNVEKTFIDLIYFKEWRKEYEKFFKKKLNFKILRDYAREYPAKIKEKIIRIGRKIAR